MSPDDEVMGFTVDLTDDEVKTLYYAVQEALRVWPGSPARPVDEQERLWEMRDTLFRMLIEISFES